mgnify:CR=1 FL=1
MNNSLFDLSTIRFEISFKTYQELRNILYFYQRNNLTKINIPCKNSLKKDFLLNAIKLSRDEFRNIDIIPHFSILHEFRRNWLDTQNAFYEFLLLIKKYGCKEVLLISGSQKRATLDSVKALFLARNNALFSYNDFSLGVAFNPYLPSHLFKEERIRLDQKLKSGLVTSVWIQFGTDLSLLKRRMGVLNNLIESALQGNSKLNKINLYGSILLPSKQFLARFKFRPWKGVYCSMEFLESEDYANKIVNELFKIYNDYNICPIIENNISTDHQLEQIKNLFKI